jgi:hypothetical protein
VLLRLVVGHIAQQTSFYYNQSEVTLAIECLYSDARAWRACDCRLMSLHRVLTDASHLRSKGCRKFFNVTFRAATTTVAAGYIILFVFLRILFPPFPMPSSRVGLDGGAYSTALVHHRHPTPSGSAAAEHPTAVLRGNNFHPLSLRFDWTNLTPTLDWTKRILQHQSNCSLPMGTFRYRNRFGLGSDLHVYAQALCNGMESQQRVRTVGNWTWMDATQCSSAASPMQCYFPQSELRCRGDDHVQEGKMAPQQHHGYGNRQPSLDNGGGRHQSALPRPRPPLSRPNGNVPEACPSLLTENGLGVAEFRTAAIESLFLRISPRVQQEAERQLQNLFGHLGGTPKDLIAVHIRWGDKVATYEGRRRKRRPEMIKVDVEEYVDAIHEILNRRQGRHPQQHDQQRPNLGQGAAGNNNQDPVNIYLATEDPTAVIEFERAIPAEWNLYVDQFLVETLPHRVDEYNGSPKMARALQGRAGLYALGSLLVAMEANDFVLTTASNWSNLMDELRRSILDPRCGNCTSLIDLRKEK